MAVIQRNFHLAGRTEPTPVLNQQGKIDGHSANPLGRHPHQAYPRVRVGTLPVCQPKTHQRDALPGHGLFPIRQNSLPQAGDNGPQAVPHQSGSIGTQCQPPPGGHAGRQGPQILLLWRMGGEVGSGGQCRPGPVQGGQRGGGRVGGRGERGRAVDSLLVRAGELGGEADEREEQGGDEHPPRGISVQGELAVPAVLALPEVIY